MTTPLGDRIKRLRLARDLTLKEVGARAGVSATHLSEIERGKTSPTVGALLRIAGALGEEASRLIDDASASSVCVVRAGARRELVEGGAVMQPLCTPVPPFELSAIAITLAPAAELPPLSAAGEQFLLVVEGVVEVSLPAASHALREGDAMHLAADDCRGIHNRGDRPARLVWVASPPALL